MIKVLFFAQLSELAGTNELDLEYEPGLSPNSLLEKLENALPNEMLSELNEGFVMVSINRKMASWDQILDDGDEIAFLPPFSGG